MQVIEYIRFLQEKVQKYEVSHPEWNQENAKIMPWSNIYFRSSWKNSQVLLKQLYLVHIEASEDEIQTITLSEPYPCAAEQGRNKWRYGL